MEARVFATLFDKYATIYRCPKTKSIMLLLSQCNDNAVSCELRYSHIRKPLRVHIFCQTNLFNDESASSTTSRIPLLPFANMTE